MPARQACRPVATTIIAGVKMVFTVGYEGADVDGFVQLLVENSIETVVDVRQLPLSRKRGFSKKALAAKLAENGLKYEHLAALGCPKEVRNRYRENGDWQQYTTSFLQHLESQDAAVKALVEMAAQKRCALMCFESDFNFCHRTMVADAVRKHSGAKVVHLAMPPRV